ncbi:MAG: histidinol-phosphate transaminase [Gilvibacter sp.]
MFNLDNLVRPNIKALAPYSSARDEYVGQGAVMLDANENPFGTVNRYPDPYQSELKERLASLKGVQPEQIFLGNGSDQVIDLLFRIFCTPEKDSAAVFDPSYGMYQVSAQINGTQLIKIPLTERFDIDKTVTEKMLSNLDIKLLFVCNPNNPTGNVLSSEQIIWLLNTFNGIVVIDEAYIDFCPTFSSLCLIERYPNVVVIQTLSKAWGMAGIRIGMAFANPNTIGYLKKVKPPYNISTPNQNFALKALNNSDEFKENLNAILLQKRRLELALKASPLINKVYPSSSNFFLVQVQDANTIYTSLKAQNLVVRNRHIAVPNCLRITVGTPQENKKLIEALNKIT